MSGHLSSHFVPFLSAFFIAVALGIPSKTEATVGSFSTAIPITVEKTRLYLEGKERREFLTIRNDSKIPVMYSATVVQPDVMQDDGGRSHQFLVSPPNGVLPAGKSETLRVLLLDNRLPQDKETMLYLRLKFVPAEQQEEGSASINSTLTLYSKLFYRPEKLIGILQIEKACDRVRAQPVDNGILLKNPTPFWITAPVFELDGKELKRGVRAPTIEPFGELLLEEKGKQLRFSCVMETGFPTEKVILDIP